MLNHSACLVLSTSVVKALTGKLDINRHSPGILYLLMLPLFVGVSCLVHVLLFSTLSPSDFAIIFVGNREQIVFLMSCDH